MEDWEYNFWKKVRKTGGSGCWMWTAAVFTKSGTKGLDVSYGAFGRRSLASKSFEATGETAAHRVSWVIRHGKIPKGLDVMHSCDTPRCVRPSHLSLGDALDNSRDKFKKRRHKFLAGCNHACATLTPEEVIYIRQQYSTGIWTMQELADLHGVGLHVTFNVIRRRTYVKD